MPPDHLEACWREWLLAAEGDGVCRIASMFWSGRNHFQSLPFVGSVSLGPPVSTEPKT